MASSADVLGSQLMHALVKKIQVGWRHNPRWWPRRLVNRINVQSTICPTGRRQCQLFSLIHHEIAEGFFLSVMAANSLYNVCIDRMQIFPQKIDMVRLKSALEKVTPSPFNWNFLIIVFKVPGLCKLPPKSVADGLQICYTYISEEAARIFMHSSASLT